MLMRSAMKVWFMFTVLSCLSSGVLKRSFVAGVVMVLGPLVHMARQCLWLVVALVWLTQGGSGTRFICVSIRLSGLLALKVIC